MTILQALDRYYDRMAARGEAEDLGFTRENISYVVSLNRKGIVRDIFDIRDKTGKIARPARLSVPRPKRTSNIQANFLWDKTAYAFGVDSGKSKRLAIEHLAFKTLHQKLLSHLESDHARALLSFLAVWAPQSFSEPPFIPEMIDASFVFRLDDEHRYFHDVPELRQIWLSHLHDPNAPTGYCLVSGKFGPIEVGHPIIKGVDGAQTAGAYLVSFNASAYTSYGRAEDATNAPTSIAAAARYGAALNALLDRLSSRNRIRVGNDTVAFWADTSGVGEDSAKAAESFVASIFEPPSTKATIDGDAQEAAKIRDKLEDFAKGRPIEDIDPHISRGTRFHVLGLAPNAARLSVRYWFENDLGTLADHFREYVTDLRLEPTPSHRPLPTVRSLVLRTAPARRDHNNKIKFDNDNISPLFAAELTRAILSGGRFPGALSSILIMRVRTDHLLDHIRISLIKAAIVRAMRLDNRLPKEDYLVRSDPDDPNPARRLGRLFAILERTQLAALGDDINTTIKDKFLGAAAATPQQVFVSLIKTSQHHTKRLRNGHSDASWIKDAGHARRVGAGLERVIGRIWGTFDNGLSAQHSIEEQGLFFVGYYQERFAKTSDTDGGPEPDAMAAEIINERE